MAHSLFLSIALWIWVLSAVGVLAILVYAWIDEGIDSTDLRGAAALLAFSLTVSGLGFCSLELLGFPLVALWSWRIISGGVTVICLLFSARMLTAGRLDALSSSEVPKKTTLSLDHLLMGGTTLLAIAEFSCAIGAAAPHASTGAQLPGREALAHTLEDSLVRLDFWHAASLGVLGCGTLLFGLLFIGALQRQGLMWFESNSGGLGGGIGGWRVSSTVGYLAATVLFGAMFGTLLVRDEGVVKTQSPPGETATPAGSKESPPVAQNPKTDSSGIGSAGPASSNSGATPANTATGKSGPVTSGAQSGFAGQVVANSSAKGATDADRNPR